MGEVKRYEFKEHKSPKLKSPEWIAYDDKGAAFIIAPFGMRKDVRVEDIITAINAYAADQEKIAGLVARTQSLATTLLQIVNFIESGKMSTKYDDEEAALITSARCELIALAEEREAARAALEAGR